MVSSTASHAINALKLTSNKDDLKTAIEGLTNMADFKFMTNEMVEQPDDKGILRYFVVVNNQGPNSDVMRHMKL